MKGERLTGQFGWKLRTNVPFKKLFANADALLAEANKYFEWCERHPLYKTELVKYKGDAEQVEVPLRRPFTMDGLTVFLGVSGAYFRAARGVIKTRIDAGKPNAGDEDMLAAITYIESVVRNQQVEGAAVGLFSGNLVCRLNNIAENVNQMNTGETVVRVTVRDQATADKLDELNKLL